MSRGHLQAQRRAGAPGGGWFSGSTRERPLWRPRAAAAATSQLFGKVFVGAVVLRPEGGLRPGPFWLSRLLGVQQGEGGRGSRASSLRRRKGPPIPTVSSVRAEKCCPRRKTSRKVEGGPQSAAAPGNGPRALQRGVGPGWRLLFSSQRRLFISGALWFQGRTVYQNFLCVCVCARAPMRRFLRILLFSIPEASSSGRPRLNQ